MRLRLVSVTLFSLSEISQRDWSSLGFEVKPYGRADAFSCTPCLSSCWTLAITEGTLESVSCPSVSCTKKRATRTTATGQPVENGIDFGETDAELVESVVGKDLRTRWERLKEKRRADLGRSSFSCTPLTFLMSSAPLELRMKSTTPVQNMN
jgi:E3 ubiquitin-protein ligase RNF14